MVSPSPSHLKRWATFFQKNVFDWGTNFVGKICRGIVLHGETNDQIIRLGEFYKIHFPIFQ